MKRPSRGPCRAVVLAAALWAAAIVPGPAKGDPPPEKIAAILAEMRDRGTQFRAERLHAMGVEGLSAVLDWFLPETAQPKTAAAAPDPRVAPLIVQLGDESSQVREAATHKLYQMGVAAQPALAEAARSSDAEVSWRAVRILRAWESERTQDVNRYTAGLSAYLTGIDDEPRLRELARRSKQVLDVGLPASGGQQQVLQLCLLTLTRAGKDEYTDGLRPLVKQGNAQVATFVLRAAVGGMAYGAPARPCPAILLDALESKEQQVVSFALNYVTVAAAEGRRADELRERLRAILKGTDENLKLQACRPLVGLFGDDAALEHLRKLLDGPKQDLARKHQALSVLSNPVSPDKPIHPKAMELLSGVIKSNDANLSQYAVNVLSAYSGEDAARALIALLGDPSPLLSNAAANGLRRHVRMPDQKMVRDLLAAAAKDNANEKVKQQAATLVKQFDASPAPSTGSRTSRIINGRRVLVPNLPGDTNPFGP